MRRLLLVVAALGLLLPGATNAVAARPRILLPDLAQGTPTNLSLLPGGSAARPRLLLAFQVTVANVGTGPLIVTGRRTAATPAMAARQVLRRSDGSSVTRARPVGSLRYATDFHQHWHFQAFDRFELWNVNATKRLRSQSEGFCVSDSFPPFKRRIPHQPRRPAFANNCGTGHPELLSIVEGLSVGWGDDATPHTSQLDVTGLPPARYLLVQRVNPTRSLLESNPFNDAACTAFTLRAPRRAGGPPRLAVLRGRTLCAKSARRWDA